jgi:hypothetical protein
MLVTIAVVLTLHTMTFTIMVIFSGHGSVGWRAAPVKEVDNKQQTTTMKSAMKRINAGQNAGGGQACVAGIVWSTMTELRVDSVNCKPSPGLRVLGQAECLPMRRRNGSALRRSVERPGSASVVYHGARRGMLVTCATCASRAGLVL